MKNRIPFYMAVCLMGFALTAQASITDYLAITTKGTDTPATHRPQAAIEALFYGRQHPVQSPSSVCLDDAGTVTVTLDGTPITGAVLNLANYGATISVTHAGGDASQDGDPTSAPGFDLAIYENGPPTATGPTAADINGDANYTGQVVGTNITGSVTFQNLGVYQNFYNAGNPIALWFAPITLDDHANQDLTENAGAPDECVNVNTTEQFNVVFLNQIDTFNFANPAVAGGDPCLARIRLQGGLPQWDASNYIITVTKNTAPFTAGTINTPTVTHNSILEFQVPEAGDYDIVVIDNNGATRTFTVPMQSCAICNDTAGTATVALGTTAESNNSSYLCFGDSLIVTHNGDADLTGDPNPATPSGLGYVMYTCAPTTSGNTIAQIAADPCIINNSGSAAGFDIVQGTTITGDVNIFNDGATYQTLLGGLGAVGEIWFAPITIDNHANGGFEAVNTTSECTNVSIGSPFSVIFLNEIQVNTFSTNICDGSFDVTGGLPQFDGSNYSVTIELVSNPTITGTLNNTITHGGTANFTVPQPGDYRITVSDNIGCESPNNTNTFVVSMNTCPFPCTGVVNATAAITSNYNGSPISCFNATDGEITVTVNGGVAPLLFNWSHDPSLTANVASSLDTGTYTIIVSDANGCADTVMATLTQPAPIVADIDTTSILCSGDSTAMAYINTITGGTAPFTYQWSAGTPTTSGDTTQNLAAGGYFVTITDANGCQSVESFSVAEPNILTTFFTDVVDTDCDASANGTATVVPQGGTTASGSYTYTWAHDPLLNDSVATNLASGTYYVTVTDDNGCAINDSVTINATKVITITTDSLNVSCGGDSTGAIMVMVTTTGGTANLPYTYTWSHDPTINNDTLTSLPAGVYYVTVTDALGCFAVDSVEITEPDTLLLGIQSLTDVDCSGNANGSVTVAATGGVPPYQYAWNTNPATDTLATLSNLTAGTYTVTVNDSNGCTATQQVVIATTSNITLTQVDTLQLACAGDMNGGFTTTYTNGVAPYQYTWSTNPATDTTNAVSGIGAGVYFLTVTDAVGCTRIDTFQLTEPLPLSGITTGDNLNCATDINGEVSILPSGGTAPYSFAWSSTATNNDTITGLTAGTYLVTITDANGCSYMDSAVVAAPPIIDITVTTTQVTCPGGANGTATATVTGGTGAYTYLWDSTQTGISAAQLTVGTHVLIVTDQNGCQQSDTFEITAVPPMLPTLLNSQPVSCFGGNDGTATIQVAGGTAPYTYTWNTNPVQDSSTAVGLTQGTYEVVVTDANGCVLAPISITVNEPQPLIIDTIITADPLCNNSATGSITVVPAGGTPSYNYSWSSNSGNFNTATGLTAGSYTVTVTDGNGCTTFTSATLNDPLLLVGQLSTSPTTCNGGKDGRIEVDTVLGGTPPYEYSIDGVNFLPTDIIFFGLFGGNYDVTIRDANGCTYEETVLVEEPALVTVDLGPDIEINLGDSTQLNAIVNTTDPLIYIWESPDSSSLSCDDCAMPWASPVTSSTYVVTVIDTNGCESSDDILVEVDKNRRAFIPNAFSPNGDGRNDRFIIFGGTGVEEILTFRVYNRWGELVHSAENFAPGDVNAGWDGRFRGQLLNPDVFVYFVEVRFSDGVVFPYKGDVTLLR